MYKNALYQTQHLNIRLSLYYKVNYKIDLTQTTSDTFDTKPVQKFMSELQSSKTSARIPRGFGMGTFQHETNQIPNNIGDNQFI